MEESTWRVSADSSLQAVLDDPACPELLSRVLTSIHSWQLRNETTVARTLRASQLMPQWVAALLALDASVSIESDGETEHVSLESVVRRETKGRVKALSIRIDEDVRWGEARVARTPSDDPIVAAFAVVRSKDGALDKARLALTGASIEPTWVPDVASALVGQMLTQEQIEKVASTVEQEAHPRGDYLGSESYRRAMAGVVTRRALTACLEQEGADE